MTLSGKQRRFLRALGHPLQVVVHVGKEGVTEALVKALDTALEAHELIKVRIADGSPATPAGRRAVALDLATKTKSEVAQVLGKTILLYRRQPDQSKGAKGAKKLQLPGA